MMGGALGGGRGLLQAEETLSPIFGATGVLPPSVVAPPPAAEVVQSTGECCTAHM